MDVGYFIGMAFETRRLGLDTRDERYLLNSVITHWQKIKGVSARERSCVCVCVCVIYMSLLLIHFPSSNGSFIPTNHHIFLLLVYSAVRSSS